MFNSWRSVTTEEKALMQSMLNDIHSQFISVLILERGIPTASAKEMAQGQVFSGRQAVTLGLIDELGGLSDAIDIAKRKTKLGDDAEVIRKSESSMQEWLQQYIGSEVRALMPDLQLVSTPKIQ